MKELTAEIFDIKRFAVHDGDGIRTTVFFKGCPLKCVWCHNPESISRSKQLGFYENKCDLCGRCRDICGNNVHIVSDGIHKLSRSECAFCGRCISACHHNALKIYGRRVTVDDILPMLWEDRDFYDNSGGGVTLSGGECLIYADFCASLLKKLKAESIHTAVDTSGFVSRENLYKIVPYTDILLYDIKAFDENVHKKCTGVSNKIILENLLWLNEMKKPVEIRIPFVPGYNVDEISKIGRFLKDLPCITRVRVLSYHNYASGKYDALSMDNTLPAVMPDEKQIQNAVEILQSCGLNAI